jgi:hypothetical protein
MVRNEHTILNLINSGWNDSISSLKITKAKERFNPQNEDMCNNVIESDCCNLKFVPLSVLIILIVVLLIAYKIYGGKNLPYIK